MKFAVLALDYDGTIAYDGALDSAVRDALDDVRARGVAVVLVTGRILEDLARVAGDLGFADAVVAENGAVVAFPASSRTVVLGRPPDVRFTQELQRRGVDVRTGACIAEMDAIHAGRALTVLRDLELPLALLFNRTRCMVLPQGISKATGLHQALRTLRLSEHNAVAVGDAENDHALLDACELGVAVEWGSRALKAIADELLPGTGPAAVADYVRRLLAASELPAEHVGRRRLLLGRTRDGADLWLAMRGRNILILGDPRSGKSFVAGLLAEQLIQHGYCVCAIDPEGDYRPLGSLSGVIVVGGDDPLPSPSEFARTLRYPDVSAVVDLSRLPLDGKREYTRAVLPLLAEQRRRQGVPHLVLVDEAHYFLDQPAIGSLLDVEAGGYTLVSYRASEIHPEFLATNPVMIVTHLSDTDAVRALHRMTGQTTADDWGALHRLATDEAVLLPNAAEACGRLVRFRVAPRMTDHVRHREKYADFAVSDYRAFVFTANGVAIGPRARTLREFADGIATASPAVFDAHVRRGDFARWLADVFGDEALAARLRDLGRGFDVSRRAATRRAIVDAIRARYVPFATVP